MIYLVGFFYLPFFLWNPPESIEIFFSHLVLLVFGAHALTMLLDWFALPRQVSIDFQARQSKNDLEKNIEAIIYEKAHLNGLSLKVYWFEGFGAYTIS